jgi:hypothetical protein
LRTRINVINLQLKEGNGNSKLLNKCKELKWYNIDIFITSNPQNYIYNIKYDMSYDDYKKSSLDLNILSETVFSQYKNENKSIRLMSLMFHLFIENPSNIPMFWILWVDKLDLSSQLTIKSSLESYLSIEENQKEWEIPQTLPISTIDKIDKILRIP